MFVVWTIFFLSAFGHDYKKGLAFILIPHGQRLVFCEIVCVHQENTPAEPWRGQLPLSGSPPLFLCSILTQPSQIGTITISL